MDLNLLYELGDNNGVYKDGLARDTRTLEQKSLDYRPPEGAALPEWKEKSESEWKKFTPREQDGSLSCFPANTLVLMQDFSYKPISEIHVGDSVITHQGRIKKVTETMQRKWQGTTKSISIYGDYEPIEATNEHPFFAIKRTKVDEGKEIDGVPDFYKAEELEKGDWLAVPFNSEIVRDTTIYDFESDPEFLWVLGLYLAEGCTDEYGVILSLHQKETDKYERVKKAMSKYDTNVACYPKKDDLGMAVHIFGKRWREIFKELGCEKCDKKEINKRLMFLAPELQMNIAQGFMDGDGSLDEGRMRIVSTSLKLLTQIKTILLRNKKYSFLQEMWVQDGKKPAWCLEFNETSRYSFVQGDYVFVLIKDIEHLTSYAGGHVYNLEVADDNSYLVRGVAVHNCMAQAGAKAYETETGIITSAHPPYRSRDNFPQGGMYAQNLGETFFKVGTTTEKLDQSQNQNESQLNRDIAVATPQKIGGYYFPYKKFIDQSDSSIDRIAQAIDANQHCIILVHAYRTEWVAIPTVSNKPANGYDFGHGVCAVDYFIYKGVKSILIEDSTGWFNSLDKKGRRILTENFIENRIYDTLTFVQVPIPPPFKFSQTLRVGSTGNEVIRLQELLNTKFVSKLPKLVADGKFGAKTGNTLKEWQTANKLVPDAIFGAKSRTVANLMI